MTEKRRGGRKTRLPGTVFRVSGGRFSDEYDPVPDHFSYIASRGLKVLGSWVDPAERTRKGVDPMNLIQAMLAKGDGTSQLVQPDPVKWVE